VSFSSDIKQELNNNHQLTNKEVVKSELKGYFITRNTNIIHQKEIKYATESDYNINRFSKLLANLDINHHIEIAGKLFVIRLAVKDVDFISIKNGQTFLVGIEETQEEHKKAIIRGAFMGSGSVNNPQKEYDDDSILQAFETNKYDYHQKITFNSYKIKQTLLHKYIFVYELRKVNNILKYKTVNDKRKYLDDVFNTAYSVNELVATSCSDDINKYIYETLFKNKTLSSLNCTIRGKTLQALQKTLESVTSVKDLRKQEVENIINEFNKKQENILRIIYKQDNQNCNTLDVKQLYNKKYPINKNYYYKKKNISTQSVVDYIESIIEKYGIEKSLLLFINKDIDKLESSFPISNYLEEKSKIMIEKEIKFIKKAEEKSLIDDIINDFLDENILDIIKYLNDYIKDIESFSLEFNINNKAQNNSKPIYKDIKELSLGQKVVAMLSFVLGYSDFSNDYSPLIIDQPEDNLDNQYIYKNLVQKLKEIKSKRQVIIATHSSTIVTNAKAEQVIVMKSDNKYGWIQATGYPNEKNIKKHIINYLEGGVESFKHKEFIYKDIL